MRKKWLVCLFTYNRFALMSNVIRSIDMFFPWGDRLIVDDGSDDPRIRTLLNRMAGQPNWQFTARDRVSGRAYGGFYRNMRYALQYAIEHGYDYCFFVEDDQQFVWKKPDYEEYVERVFQTCPDAIQIQPLLARRILDYSSGSEYIRTAHAYRTNRGFNTTAIWNLDAVRRHPDYEVIWENGDDLPLNSAYWLRKGYRVYSQFDPTLAIAPWIDSQSSFQRPSAREAHERDLLLKPLSDAEIRFLTARSPEIAPYQEYFQLSRKNMQRPIWHQQGQNLNRFFSLCRQIVESEDAAHRSPKPISILEEWHPSTLTPVQSHLNWKPPSKQVRPITYRFGPRWGKRLERWIDFLRFSPRDYRGYRELTRRLRREQQNLLTSLKA